MLLGGPLTLLPFVTRRRKKTSSEAGKVMHKDVWFNERKDAEHLRYALMALHSLLWTNCTALLSKGDRILL